MSDKGTIRQDTIALGALLEEVMKTAKFTPVQWHELAGETETLGEQLVRSVRVIDSGAPAELSRQLRTMLAMMRKAHHERQFDATKTHAGEALQLANQLKDWASK